MMTTTTTINAVMAPRRGNPDIKMAIAMASSKAGTKGERTIRRISALPARARPAGVIGTGWGRFGFIKMAIGTDIALDSVRATTMRAVHGATATAIPMTSQPSTAAAVMADPGSVIGPTRLVFRTVHRWDGGTLTKESPTTPIRVGVMTTKTTAIAARTETRALIRLNTGTATVLATSLHATATKLFQAASRDELPGQSAARPGEGAYRSSARFSATF